MSEKVLLTSDSNPIYHNPNPTEPDDIEFKNRWKGYCLFDYYETGEVRFWEGGQAKKELSRYVVVWDGEKPISFLDGVWCESEGWHNEDAVLAPGTSSDTADSFREWVHQNPGNQFGIDTLNIDRRIVIDRVRGDINDAKKEMETLFDSYLKSIQEPTTAE